VSPDFVNQTVCRTRQKLQSDINLAQLLAEVLEL